MALPDFVRGRDVWRPRSTATARRRLAVLALVAGLAAILLAGMVERSAPDTITFPRSAISANPPFETLSPQPSSLSGLRRDTPRANTNGDADVGVALAELERQLQAASDEDLDLIVAANLPEIVQRDPRDAARFIELQPASKQREALVRHFSRLWGESDAEGAFAWAQSLPDARESDLANSAVCLSLSRANPAAAVKRCGEYGADPAGDADFQGIFQAWVQSDSAAAGEWLAAQPASARLDKLRQRQVFVLAKTSPLQALGIAQQGFTAQADRDEAVVAVLHQWGLQDPSAARDWARNSSPEELKARALAEIDGIETYAASR